MLSKGRFAALMPAHFSKLKSSRVTPMLVKWEWLQACFFTYSKVGPDKKLRRMGGQRRLPLEAFLLGRQSRPLKN